MVVDMKSKTNHSIDEIFENAKPYENDDEWVDDCRTLEEFARSLATFKKSLKRVKDMDLSQKELDDMCFDDTLTLDQIEKLAIALQEQETKDN